MVAKSSGVRHTAEGHRRRPGAARLAGLGVGGAALLTLLTGCGEWVGNAFGGFGWPEGGITQQSERMYDLWIGSVIAALAVGFFVWGLIFWCVVRYRKRGDELPPQTRFNMPMEVLYTVTPVLVVCVLFYYTAVVQTDVLRATNNPDTVVEVVPFKWNWQFNYRDGVGEDAQTIASTVGSSDVIPLLVVPSGQRIRFEQNSRDVIHSFWVPEMLFKLDVFPGNIRNTWDATIEQEGRYVGRCAELCGTYHAFMNFELVVVSPDRFQRFLAAKQAGRSTQDAMGEIGFVGEERFAVTTTPFETRRDVQNWNPSDTVAQGN